MLDNSLSAIVPDPTALLSNSLRFTRQLSWKTLKYLFFYDL